MLATSSPTHDAMNMIMRTQSSCTFGHMAIWHSCAAGL